MTTTTSKFTIPAMQTGQELEIRSVFCFRVMGRRVILAKADNAVYTLSHSSEIDLTDTWRVNDTVRRAWCKLTGHKMAEIKAEMAKRRTADRKRAREADERRLRSLANRLGYKLARNPTKAAP